MLLILSLTFVYVSEVRATSGVKLKPHFIGYNPLV